MTLVFVLCREERGVRATVAERHAEALRVSDRDVGPPFAGRSEQREREQVGGHDHQGTGRVCGGRKSAIVPHRTVGRRILDHDRADGRVDIEPRRVADDHRHPACRRARAHHVDRLRMAVGVDEHGVFAVARDAMRHGHGFGRRGSLIEQRRVRDRQRGEIADHRLIVEQRLEAALRDLGLVRRVGGVPARILQNVSLNDGGCVCARVPHADE